MSALKKDDSTFDEWTRYVQQALHFVPYAPVLFISAKTGQRVDKILDLGLQINAERHTRIPTGKLNAILRDAVYNHPPTSIHKGAHLRIFYATQAQVAPPVFLFFSNAPEEIHFGYKRYLENRIREAHPYMGTPIILVFRNRDDD